MLVLLLSIGLALGQDTGDTEAHDDLKVLGPLTLGQDIALDDKGRPVFRLTERYWLIRDDALRTSVANARTVPRLEAALTACRDSAVACGVDAAAAWGTMRQQFDDDTRHLDELLQQTTALSTKLQLAEADLSRVKRQRNTAYLIVGGIAAAVLVGTGVGFGLSAH